MVKQKMFYTDISAEEGRGVRSQGQKEFDTVTFSFKQANCRPLVSRNCGPC